MFAASDSDKSTKSLLSDLRTFEEYYKKDESFRVALLTPSLRTERENILADVFETTGINNSHARHALSTLASRNHLDKVIKVVHDIEALASHNRKEIIAKVTSAEALSSEQVSNLTSALKKRIPSDSNLIIEQVVEPSILGGLNVQLGNQSLDISVLARIAEIDRLLRAAKI